MKIIEKRHKVFVIDDDCTSRILVSEILTEANVTIIECGCGEDAILLFKKHFTDIVMVLLDIELPRCNGWDLGKQFRDMKPEVVIIAVSAIWPDELALGCKESGFDGLVSKPFDINKFRELVTSYL
jgi:CheY-like chemotaxis protein